jgi:hypothetical protein
MRPTILAASLTHTQITKITLCLPQPLKHQIHITPNRLEARRFGLIRERPKTTPLMQRRLINRSLAQLDTPILAATHALSTGKQGAPILVARFRIKNRITITVAVRFCRPPAKALIHAMGHHTTPKQSTKTNRKIYFRWRGKISY